MNMTSTTGLSPVIAAPTAAPTMAASEMGVSRTRSGPNLSSSPRVTPNGPPAAATSSPNKTTVGSLAMASASARLMACPKRTSAMRLSCCKRVDVVEYGFEIGLASRTCTGDRGIYTLRRDPCSGRNHVGRGALSYEAPLQPDNGVVFAAERRLFFL